MDTDLFKAAADGNIEPFKELEAKHLQLEQILTQFFKDTILHVYVTSRNETNKSTEFVEQILDMCPSLLLQVNAKGDTPLHVAAKCGHSAIADVLIRRAKSRIQDVESGLRPEWEMLKMTNNENNTALHEAVRHHRLNVVAVLAKEADPDFSYYANNSGQTPLYLAAIEERSFPSSLMVSAIFESCKSAAHQGPNGQTALHAAAIYSKSGKAELDPKKDEHGWTPLHYASYYGRASNAQVLLEYDKSAAFIGDKDRKMTALHMAAGQGHLQTIKTIISHCPECYELVDNRGWNVLHFAMLRLRAYGQITLLRNPLMRSLINEKDANGNTPLHVLASNSLLRPISSFYYNQCNGDRAAVNKQNVTVEYISEYGCPELEQEIRELFEDVGEGRQYPNGVINKRKLNSKNKSADVDGNKETRASHLVVATLIATVTFAAAFTSPGGYDSDQGTAILRRNSAFQAFIITDTIAMTLSLSAVFIHLFMSFKDLQESKNLFLKLFVAAVYLIIFAMGAMVVAFVTGVYAVLAPSLGLAITTCLIGLIFFLLVLWALRPIVAYRLV